MVRRESEAQAEGFPGILNQEVRQGRGWKEVCEPSLLEEVRGKTGVLEV